MSFYENEGLIDYKSELSRYEEAAAVGDELAFATIGWFYENGYGVKKDYKKALEWYKKGVNAVDPQAMRNYGGLYDDGLGVEKNEEKGLHWCIVAHQVEKSCTFRDELKRIAEDRDLTTMNHTPPEYQCCFGEEHFFNHLRRK